MTILFLVLLPGYCFGEGSYVMGGILLIVSGILLSEESLKCPYCKGCVLCYGRARYCLRCKRFWLDERSMLWVGFVLAFGLAVLTLILFKVIP